MDFTTVLKFLVESFQKEKIDFAIIGGLALQSSGVTRATMDIDLLMLVDYKEKIKEILTKKGYNLIYQSNDVLNFHSSNPDLGRVDFLLAQRKYTKKMLEEAKEKEFLNGQFKIKIVKVEDQIGLKIQSSSNDKTRLHKDMADIELLIKNNSEKLDIQKIREYFIIFNREKELNEILDRIPNAK